MCHILTQAISGKKVMNKGDDDIGSLSNIHSLINQVVDLYSTYTKVTVDGINT